MCVHVLLCTYGGQKRVLDPLKPDYGSWECPGWVLGSAHKSLGGWGVGRLELLSHLFTDHHPESPALLTAVCETSRVWQILLRLHTRTPNLQPDVETLWFYCSWIKAYTIKDHGGRFKATLPAIFSRLLFGWDCHQPEKVNSPL